MKKHGLVLGLVIVLLVCLAAPAEAALEDIRDNPYRDAIERMVELGVLEGRGDGRFYPEDLLTRAEAAKVGASLLGYDAGDAEEAALRPTAFDDVYPGMEPALEWAVGWIHLIADEGIILGDGHGNYDPGDNLEMAEWAAILIRILGHEKEDMAWPHDYDALAEQLGLVEDIEYLSDATVNRAEMAQFTSLAVHVVPMADGSLLLDVVEWPSYYAEEEVDDDHDIAQLQVEVDMSPEYLPPGGGETASIIVTVTDERGHPVSGADVQFHAYAHAGDRSSQFSNSQVQTDVSGQATTQYTSIGDDDRKLVDMDVAVTLEPLTEHAGAQILAAESAAQVSGTIYDPYTGEPVEAQMFFEWRDGQQFRKMGGVDTDSQGRYSVLLPVGQYVPWVTFPDGERDVFVVDVTEADTSHTIDYRKGILKGTVTGLSPDTELMAIPRDFQPGPADHTLMCRTDDTGRLSYHLEPGTYHLEIVGRPDLGIIVPAVEVQSGEVTDFGTVSGP